MIELMGQIAIFTASVSDCCPVVLAAALAMGTNLMFNGAPLTLIAYKLAIVMITQGFMFILNRSGRAEMI